MRHETVRLMPMAVMLIAAASVLLPFALADGAEGYDADLGDIHSMTVQFVFTGSDAESVEWDFGDGTPVSAEWSPVHVYKEKGEYIVTQTASNSYNNGSTTTMRFHIDVLGYPSVTFDCRGGSCIEAIELSSPKGMIEMPADPTRPGYRFDGWYIDRDCTQRFDRSSEVTESMTLYAGWTGIAPVMRTVSFDCDGGSMTVDPIVVESGNAIEVPGYDGTRGRQAFDGWSCDGLVLMPGDSLQVDSDMVLRALWRDAETVVVSFDPQGGSVQVEDMTVQSGEAFSIPGYEGSRSGFSFVGWILDGAAMKAGTTACVWTDTVLEASWEPYDDGDGAGGFTGFVEENPMALAAAAIAIIVAALIAVRAGKA